MIPKYDSYKLTRPPKSKQRRCLICGCKLSKFNYNKFCFAHTVKGFDMEYDRRQKHLYESSTKGRLKRMAEKKRKAKKRV